MDADMQKRFREECQAYSIWAGGKVATHQDMSGYFFVRAVELYLKTNGKIAFVLPYASMPRKQFEGFRKGLYGTSQRRGSRLVYATVQFTGAWVLSNDVQPLFPVPSRTRDAFVGILFVIGWFLFAYKGYEKMDNIAGYLACVFALGVAIFPNSVNGWERIVHFSSAACLFLILSFFSLFLFTKTKDSPKGFRPTMLSAFRFGAAKSGNSMSREKKKRNIVYIVCGIVMLACIALIGLYMLFWQNTVISNIKPVFCLEWLMIWAFGTSWFIKGETILKDK
jgi:hypothetical protein